MLQLGIELPTWKQKLSGQCQTKPAYEYTFMGHLISSFYLYPQDILESNPIILVNIILSISLINNLTTFDIGPKSTNNI